MEMKKIQSSEICGSWDAKEHKPSLFFPLSIHSQILCSTMKQNALEYNQTPFPPSGTVITQPHSQLGVEFDPFNPQHELQLNPSRVFFIIPTWIAPFP